MSDSTQSSACRRSRSSSARRRHRARRTSTSRSAPGEFVSLIGPSGCGKSTLLRIIGDLIQPTSGTVAGERQDRAPGPRSTATTGSSSRTRCSSTGARSRRTSRCRSSCAAGTARAARARVEEMLELVELTGFESHHPWQLSGGMQQRVVDRARALVLPAAAADGRALRRARRDDARAAQHRAPPDLGGERAATVVFVTHSIAEAVFLSTRVVVMSPRPGRIADVIDDRPARSRARGRRARSRASSSSSRDVRRRCTPAAGATPRTRRADAEEQLSIDRRRAGPARAPARVGGRARDWIPAVVVFVLGHRRSGRGYDARLRRRARSCCRRPRTILEHASGTTAATSGRGLVTRSRRRSAASCSARALGDPLRARCSRASAALGRAFMPYAIAANAIPIIAFAPITNNWFGS